MTPRTTFSLLLLGLTLVGAGMVAIDTYFDHLAFEELKSYVDHAIERHVLEGSLTIVPLCPEGQKPLEIWGSWYCVEPEVLTDNVTMPREGRLR